MKIAHTTTKSKRESLSNCCKYCLQLHGCTQIQCLAGPVGACARTCNSTIECCSYVHGKFVFYLHFIITCSCWLPTDKGMIFAFVVPMIAIIMVSSTVLHMHTYALVGQAIYTQFLCI